MKKEKTKKVKESKTKESKTKESKKIWKTLLNIFLIGAIGVVSICLVFILYIVISSPDFVKKELYQKEPTILYDVNGNEFARVGAKDSTVITYDEIPDVLIDALIATEDSRFFQHNGLDLFRFLKASVLQILGKHYAGGASTISMQVIKNTYTGREDEGIEGIIRKFTDIYMAVFKLEANYTKEEIIEFYFNSQWFANAGDVNIGDGIWGIEQASYYFFGKSAKDLNLAEASLLVGMFQNTRTNNPYNYPENARVRQTTVLKLMVRHGYITEDEMNAVLEIPISSMLATKQDANLEANSNQAFIDYVLNEVKEDLKVNPKSVSLHIYTTYDPSVQEVLERAENGEFYKYPNDKFQEGIAVTRVTDGSIAGLSGGRDYQAGDLLNRSIIRKQPGSTAKPIFDYAMYIENISQSTYAMFLDEPTTYSNGQKISNYDNKYKNLITMRYALKDSRNIPALKAFKAVYKIDKNIIADFVHSVGIDYGPDLLEAFSIGGLPNGTSPLELSAAYASFGRGGYYIEPYAYTKVINNETGKETNYSYKKVKVMEETTAYMINDILDEVYGGGNKTIAGKTGTTNLDGDTKDKFGLKSNATIDAWLVTYSPSYSIALWIGYDKLTNESGPNKYYLTDTSMRSTIMKGLIAIHKGGETFKKPKGLTEVNVELETFPPQLCSAYTPNASGNDLCETEYFVSGTEPTDVSSRFDTLNNPSNPSYTLSGNTITLKWDPIKTPDAIDNEKLLAHFKKYYETENLAVEYYNKRLTYNANNIGTLGYEVTVKTPNGTEQNLGWITGTSINYTAPVGGEYTFTIKSSYSIFKANKSSGLTYTVKTIDNNVSDIVTDDNSDDDNTQDNDDNLN